MGHIHGMLTNYDFYQKLCYMTELVEQTNELSGFVVRRGGNILDPKLDYSFVKSLDLKEPDNLDAEIASGRLGSLIVSKSCDELERPINAVAPVQADLEASMKLARENPGVVHGLAAPEPLLGGMSLLLYRQSPHRVLLPGLFAGVPAERCLRTSREIMHQAGLNSVLIRYASHKCILGAEQDVRLFH